jgi:hypothetical protein
LRRETRTLLVLLVLAVAGVVALALVADRYRRVAERVLPGSSETPTAPVAPPR